MLEVILLVVGEGGLEACPGVAGGSGEGGPPPLPSPPGVVAVSAVSSSVGPGEGEDAPPPPLSTMSTSRLTGLPHESCRIKRRVWVRNLLSDYSNYFELQDKEKNKRERLFTQHITRALK